MARLPGLVIAGTLAFLLTVFLPERAAATVGVSGLPFGGVIQDTDLSGIPGPRIFVAPGAELRPDRVEMASAPQQLIVQVLREVNGGFQPVPGLVFFASGPSFGMMPATTNADGEARWAANCSEASRVQVRAELKDSYFSIASSGYGAKPYRFVAEVGCEGLTKLIVRGDSDGGQALGIWQIAHRGKLRLQSSVGLAFWKRPIVFAWPGDGDYYTGGVVTVTRGDHWDVVGHEMGHAIYDLGQIGGMQGGQHKIDECYTSTLALSEGWASYFSGFVSVALDDPDARFEFLVPRRAPVRFENIPADVCAGETNEWRVTGFFWDLIDRHDDGESIEQDFGSIWSAMAGSMVRSTREATRRIEGRGAVPGSVLESVWRRNFLK
jgi:hypothetical protein